MGSTKDQLDKLQRALNMEARVVKCIQKYDPFRVHLFELHWLRVPQRIQFKGLTIVFKCLNNLAPEYLQDFLVLSRKTTCDQQVPRRYTWSNLEHRNFQIVVSHMQVQNSGTTYQYHLEFVKTMRFLRLN